MKLIVAIIRPEKLDEVKAELFKEEVTGLTISRVSGHGGEKEHLETYRGRPLVFEFHEKVRLEIAVSEPFVQRTVVEGHIQAFETQVGSALSALDAAGSQMDHAAADMIQIAQRGTVGVRDAEQATSEASSNVSGIAATRVFS